MKFPNIGAERLHTVESGIEYLKNRVAEMERYASAIPHKRGEARNDSPETSHTVQLNLVVADVEFDLLAGAGTGV